MRRLKSLVPNMWSPEQQHQSSWELRKANPQAHPTPTESETLEVGPSDLRFLQALQGDVEV